MSRTAPLLLLSLCFVACADKSGGGGDGDGGSTDSGPSDSGDPLWDSRFDAVAAAAQKDLAASDAPGVSIAIMEGGVVTFAAAFGSKSADSDEPVTTETLFQIGSTTKMLTSIGLLQDVDDGLLSLDDSLADALTGSDFAFDETWNDQVRIEHLLTHQGGFYDYLDWSGSSDDSDLDTWHTEVYFPNLWLMNEPGAFWNYSNPNFNLAGLIVERNGGEAWADLMQTRVLGPLGMDRTYLRKTDVEADGDYALGVGYWFSGANNTVTEYGSVTMDEVGDPASARPAGSSTWSTPTQMMEVARYLIEGNPAVLSDALHDQQVTEQVALEYGLDGQGYGYGLFVYEGFYAGEEFYSQPLWEHGGNTLSHTSGFYILPEQGFAISILSSGYGTDFGSTVIAALTSVADLGEPVTPPELSFDPDRLDDHVGTYDDAYNVGEMIITRDGDALNISMPFLDELGYDVNPVLETYGDTVFYLEIDGAWYDLSFLGAEAGEATPWIRNRAFVGTRVEESGQAFTGGPLADPTEARARIDRQLRLARSGPTSFVRSSQLP
jgi:CubicO group peptidase (beta-lactamase class C family)